MTPFTAQDIINQTNLYRQAQGLTPLAISEPLMKAAQERVEEMAASGIFAHNFSTTTMKDYGYENFTLAGENLAHSYPTATDTMRAWQESPTHNKNLTEPKFSEMGVAIVPGVYQGKPTHFVVQFFGNGDQSIVPVAPPRTATSPKIPARVVEKAMSKLPAKVPTPKPAPLFVPTPVNNANSTIPMARQTSKVPMLITQKG